MQANTGSLDRKGQRRRMRPILAKNGRLTLMPDSDGWLDLMTEGSPPDGLRVDVKCSQNLGGTRWEPYQSFAVLTPSGWIGEHGGDHLNLEDRYGLTHWRPADKLRIR